MPAHHLITPKQAITAIKAQLMRIGARRMNVHPGEQPHNVKPHHREPSTGELAWVQERFGQKMPVVAFDCKDYAHIFYRRGIGDGAPRRRAMRASKACKIVKSPQAGSEPYSAKTRVHQKCRSQNAECRTKKERRGKMEAMALMRHPQSSDPQSSFFLLHSAFCIPHSAFVDTSGPSRRTAQTRLGTRPGTL